MDYYFVVASFWLFVVKRFIVSNFSDGICAIYESYQILQTMGFARQLELRGRTFPYQETMKEVGHQWGELPTTQKS